MTAEALLERIADGRTDLVWPYLAAGHPAVASHGGLRLLEWCAYYGDVSAMRFLLERGESLASLGPDLGLNGAAFHGHWRLCEFLLEAGADANVAGAETAETPLHMRDCRTKGETPLHRAAAFGTEETIDLLRAAGARIDARDASGDTPLGWASWYGRPDAVLRKLLYGEHSIRPGRRSMRLSLLGWPRGGTPGRGRE